MRPNVVFVILNWNGKQFLETCLKSVFAQDYGNYRVVLVDNGSADGSADLVKNNFPRADLLALPENSGYPKGNNSGIRHAVEKYPADYVLLLNNDTEIRSQGWLSAMVDEAEADPAAGVLGCKLVYPDGKVQNMGRRITPCGFPVLTPGQDDLDFSRPYYADAVIGAAFLIKRAVIEKIGLLDEGFSPFAVEDMDYCARTARAGYRVKVVPGAEVVHYTSQTIKRLPSYSSRLNARKGEIRFKLLNLSFFQLVSAMFNEVYELAANVLERKDRNGRYTPVNARLRPEWRENLSLFFRAYLRNLADAGDILAKRLSRGKKIW